MKNPFKRSGFDTLISSGTRIFGSLELQPDTTTVLDGHIDGPGISCTGKATLVVAGTVQLTHNLTVPNVTVTGQVKCDVLYVEGTLAVKNGAKVEAREVRYRNLVIEPGGVLLAQMIHLDHVAADS